MDSRLARSRDVDLSFVAKAREDRARARLHEDAVLLAHRADLLHARPVGRALLHVGTDALRSGVRLGHDVEEVAGLAGRRVERVVQLFALIDREARQARRHLVVALKAHHVRLAHPLLVAQPVSIDGLLVGRRHTPDHMDGWTALDRRLGHRISRGSRRHIVVDCARDWLGDVRHIQIDSCPPLLRNRVGCGFRLSAQPVQFVTTRIPPRPSFARRDGRSGCLRAGRRSVGNAPCELLAALADTRVASRFAARLTRSAITGLSNSQQSAAAAAATCAAECCTAC